MAGTLIRRGGKEAALAASMCFMLLILPGVRHVRAEPAITLATSSPVSHGGTIEIQGSGFGAKNPAGPVFWDDCETRTVNDPSALVREGGYVDYSPGTMSYARQDPAEPSYDALQYRLAGFRNVPQTHSRSTKFLAGGHNSFRKLTVSTYRWTRSSRGTNEYYCELAAGGNPSWSIDSAVGYFMLGTTLATRGTRGTLSDHQWDYGDNDGLGYRTWYFRDDSGDPDGTGVTLWGGTNDLTPGQVGTNVMAMVCVPPQGGVANCSRNQSWTNVYVSFYTTFDPRWPTNGIYNSNEKVLTFENGDTVYSITDYYMTDPDISRGMAVTGIKNKIPGNSDPCDVNGRGNCMPSPIGSWQHWEWRVTKSSFIQMVQDNAVRITQSGGVTSSENKTGISVGGYYCYGTALSNCVDNNQKVGHPNAFRYFDDLYIDNTWSRIVLANNSTYENATIVEPQIPTVWSAGSLACRANLGKLPAGGTAYLFVFDANNVHNPRGYPVTLAGGAISAPRDLRIEPPQ